MGVGDGDMSSRMGRGRVIDRYLDRVGWDPGGCVGAWLLGHVDHAGWLALASKKEEGLPYVV